MGFVARMEDTRPPKCVMFGGSVGGAGCMGGQKKEWMGCFLDDLFRQQRRPVDDCSPGRGGMAQNGGTKGAEHFMAKWIAAEKANKAALRCSVVCPNVTGKPKERIARSKRARAGSLTLAD